MKRLLTIYDIANDWVEDPVGLVTIFLFLFLFSVLYYGITK